MIHIQFNLSDISKTEARAMIAMLEVVANSEPVSKVLTKEANQDPATWTGAPTAPPLTPEQSKVVALNVAAAVEGEAKRRPGRPPKAAATAAPVTPLDPPAPATPPDPTPAPNGSAVAAAPSPEPPNPPAAAGAPRSFTVDEMRQALQDYTGVTDLKHGKELLSSFGCVRVTDMEAKDAAAQTDFMIKCGWAG